MSLDTNVYNLPSFSEKAYKMGKERQEERKSDVGYDKAEETFNLSKTKFTGDRLRDIELAWKAYEEAAVESINSGNKEMTAKAKQAKAAFDAVVGAHTTQVSNANEKYAEAQANNFEGYAQGADVISKNYSDFVNKKWESKYEDGVLKVKEGDQWVNWNESSIYSVEINPNNAFLAPKAVKTGKYALPDAFVGEITKGVTSANSSDEAKSMFDQEFTYKLENDPEFMTDVALHYEIAGLKKISGVDGVTPEKLAEVRRRMVEDEAYREKAIQKYKETGYARIDMTRSVKSTAGMTSYVDKVKAGKQKIDVEFLIFPDNKRIGSSVAIGLGADGNYYKRTKIGDIYTNVLAEPADIAMIEQGLGRKVSSLFAKDEPEVTAPEETKTGEEPKQTTVKPEEVEAVATELDGIELDQEANEEDPLNIGITPQTGVAPPASETEETNVSSESMLLPETFYENLIDYEGGIATGEEDPAYDANPDAPMVNGKRAHTNRGVQYRVFKDWAKKEGIPENKWENRFINLTANEALKIVDQFAENSGANQFESPVLRSLFTQNSWGTGKVWAADFKSGRSKDYRALLDWLQEETGLDFKHTGKITSEEAKAIEELYKKDPKKFVNTFIDKKKTYFTSLGDNYKAHGDGWNKRAEDLRNRMLAEVG